MVCGDSFWAKFKIKFLVIFPTDVESEGNEDTKLFIKPTDFDLPLNETLNIIKDYFEIKQPGGSALHQSEKSQEI